MKTNCFSIFFLPFCFFEILFFHHFGWPRFSLFASLFRQCNRRVCWAPQQTVSRGSRIREERETLLLIHQPTQLRRMKNVCHEPSQGISHSFFMMPLPSCVYRSTDDVMVDSRGHPRLPRDDVGTRIIKPKPRQVPVMHTRPISIMRDA